ncbi:MAG: hypothetical protein KBD19_00200 [Candidatus Moranbacteria bacterium]|nr:hypothetical protein [Candidatus Moranbacteria bacterium]
MMSKRAVIVSLLLLFGLATAYFVYAKLTDGSEKERADPETMLETVSYSAPQEDPVPVSQEIPKKVLPPPPPPPDMDRMKREGCVTDGLLNGDFPGDGKTFKLMNDSGCYYLHRSIGTWLDPPDWEDIDRNMAALRPGFLHGMFIAEAIDTKAKYFSDDEGRRLDFGEMCRSGSKNFWGEHTCKPSFQREEYRTYIRSITREAMDRNVQVFMFGQVYLQDASDLSESAIPDIIREMRQYAAIRDMRILVGAQTNDIADPSYLGLFDFIEGGVGIDAEGDIENGPCHSRWWKRPGDWCWGLLWNERFSKHARNVFLHYDWSGKIGDDMSVFTRMSKEKREETTRRLHTYFIGKDMGFLLPYLARLHVDNGGCTGPGKRYYTPDDRYHCDDEAAWNRILQGK